MNDISLVQHQRSLDGIVQLPHIPRPLMIHKRTFCVLGKGNPGQLHFAAMLFKQRSSQRHDIQRPLPERLPVHREHCQTIIEVFPELALANVIRQIPVGGRYNTDIQADGLTTTNPLHFPLLQYPQKLGLKPQIHLRNLVQQNGAAVGLLEFAGRGGDGTGKGTFLVTEQDSLQHVFRYCSTVDRHEWLL